MNGIRISFLLIFFLSFSFLLQAEEVANESMHPAYPVKYRYGDLTLEKNSYLDLMLKAESLELHPVKTKKKKKKKDEVVMEILKLPISKARGAKTAPGGVWIYWFGKDSVTRSAFFACDKEIQEQLATEINNWTQGYYQQKYQKYKDQYEAYEREAIESAD
jgi:hypothetical protein